MLLLIVTTAKVQRLSETSNKTSNKSNIKIGKTKANTKSNKTLKTLILLSFTLLFISPTLKVYKISKLTNRIETSDVEAKENTLWQNGDLILSKVTIKEIARTLERRFKVKTITSDNISNNERYTMNFKAYEKLHDVLNILSQTNGNIKCELRSNTVFIMKKGG